MRLNPDMQEDIYSLLYTGTKMDEADFGTNFLAQYKRFYSFPIYPPSGLAARHSQPGYHAHQFFDPPQNNRRSYGCRTLIMEHNR